MTSLATAFHVLSERELGPYGLMHSYWLAKFFGYERSGRGVFVKDTGVWGNDSWAKTFCETPVPVTNDVKRETAALIRRQFREDVTVLERTFDAAKRLSSDSLVAKASLGRRTVRTASMRDDKNPREVVPEM